MLMQDSKAKPITAFVDLGYRGVDADNPDVHIEHRGKSRRISEQERKLLKRRQAIEPIIGHLKADHRMDRCHLKGERGDRMHAVLCAAGYNIKWLLRMIIKKGVTFLQRLYLRLFTMAGAQPNCWLTLRTWLAPASLRPASCVVHGFEMNISGATIYPLLHERSRGKVMIFIVRIPLMADSDSIPIADSVPCDVGHLKRAS